MADLGQYFSDIPRLFLAGREAAQRRDELRADLERQRAEIELRQQQELRAMQQRAEDVAHRERQYDLDKRKAESGAIFSMVNDYTKAADDMEKNAKSQFEEAKKYPFPENSKEFKNATALMEDSKKLRGQTRELAKQGFEIMLGPDNPQVAQFLALDEEAEKLSPASKVFLEDDAMPMLMQQYTSKGGLLSNLTPENMGKDPRFIASIIDVVDRKNPQAAKEIMSGFPRLEAVTEEQKTEMDMPEPIRDIRGRATQRDMGGGRVGVFVPVEAGEPVIAPVDGTVKKVVINDPKYGNVISIADANGNYHTYTGLADVSQYAVNDPVVAGAEIGTAAAAHPISGSPAIGLSISKPYNKPDGRIAWKTVNPISFMDGKSELNPRPIAQISTVEKNDILYRQIPPRLNTYKTSLQTIDRNLDALKAQRQALEDRNEELKDTGGLLSYKDDIKQVDEQIDSQQKEWNNVSNEMHSKFNELERIAISDRLANYGIASGWTRVGISQGQLDVAEERLAKEAAKSSPLKSVDELINKMGELKIRSNPESVASYINKNDAKNTLQAIFTEGLITKAQYDDRRKKIDNQWAKQEPVVLRAAIDEWNKKIVDELIAEGKTPTKPLVKERLVKKDAWKRLRSLVKVEGKMPPISLVGSSRPKTKTTTEEESLAMPLTKPGR